MNYSQQELFDLLGYNPKTKKNSLKPEHYNFVAKFSDEQQKARENFREKGVAAAMLLSIPAINGYIAAAETRTEKAKQRARLANQQVRQMKKLANTDSLTGLPNRRELKNAFFKMLHPGASVGLLVLDADNFGEVNNSYGHKTGDVVLKEISEVLVSTLRKSDTASFFASRYGGDEFVVLLDLSAQKGKHRDTTLKPEQRLDGAVNRLHAAFSDYVSHDKSLEEVGLGMSVGKMLWDGQMGPEEFFDQADMVMYQQKRLREIDTS